MAALTYSISNTEKKYFTTNTVMINTYVVRCIKSLSIGSDPLVSPNLIKPELAFSQS
jgi:hypothetical protein